MGIGAGSPTKVVRTFLLTDIVGSTELWAREPVQMVAAIARHGELIAACVASAGGELIREKGEGDSAFAAFELPSAAITAAIDIGTAFAAEPWTTSRPVTLRVGLHTGEAIADRGDYLGMAVNKCARLRALAGPGNVLLSAATAGLVRQDMPAGASLVAVGEVELRGLAERETVYQVLHAALPDRIVGLGSAARGCMPPAVALVGRENELAAIGRALETSGRFITLLGPGGAGKTALAVAAANRAATAFRHGAWFVDAREVRQPDALIGAIAAALDLDSPSKERILEHLREREMLLVVDNMEQVERPYETLAALAAAGANVRILATSRSRLGGANEIVVAVGPLGFSDGRDAEAEPLSPAAQLFCARARDARPDFDEANADLGTIESMVRRLDGLPLAIELAAARLRALSLSDLAARINSSLAVLDARSAPRTLQSTIRWSWDLLAADERHVLAALSVFSGTVRLDVAERVCAAVDASPLDVFDAIAALVDRSLVQLVETGSATQYRLLESIREFASERLAEDGEVAHLIRRRHLDWCLHVARAEDTDLSARNAVADDLIAATWWGLDNDPTLGVELAVTLRWWLRNTTGAAVARPVLQAALGKATDAASRHELLIGIGFSHADAGEADAAREAFELAAELEPSDGWCWYYIGHQHLANNELDAAEAAYRTSWEIAERADDQRLVAWSLNNLGLVASARNDLHQMRAWFQRSLEVAVASGATIQELTARFNLDNVEYDLGLRVKTPERALAYADMARRGGGHMQLVESLCEAALRFLDSGDLDRATATAEEALDTAAKVYVTRVPAALITLAWCRRATGHDGEARLLVRRAFELAPTADIVACEGPEVMSAIAADRGDAQAVREMQERTPTRRESLAVYLGAALLASGDAQLAMAELGRALRAADSKSRPVTIAAIALAAAEAAASLGAWDTAARLLGAAHHIHPLAPSRRVAPPAGFHARERCVAALGQARFDKAFSAGAALGAGGADAVAGELTAAG